MESGRGLTVSRVRELFTYDAQAGALRWRPGKGKRGAPAGAIAGTPRPRGRRIIVDGREYLAHRLTRFYFTGRWPGRNRA